MTGAEYSLTCPHCSREGRYIFLLGTGAGILLCPHCNRPFRVETWHDRVTRISPQ